MMGVKADKFLHISCKEAAAMTKTKIKCMMKMRYGRCEKTIMLRDREPEMLWLPACNIRRFMVVWRYGILIMCKVMEDMRKE